MPDSDRNAERCEAPRIRTVSLITALHAIAEIMKHLGDAAHPDAADSDKMDLCNVSKHKKLSLTGKKLFDQIRRILAERFANQFLRKLKSTHAAGQMPLRVQLIAADGKVLKEVTRG